MDRVERVLSHATGHRLIQGQRTICANLIAEQNYRNLVNAEFLCCVCAMPAVLLAAIVNNQWIKSFSAFDMCFQKVDVFAGFIVHLERADAV